LGCRGWVLRTLRKLKNLRNTSGQRKTICFCRSTCSCLLPICQRPLF
jgi:hypothetical protein